MMTMGLSAVLGLMVGLLVNYLADVLPQQRKLCAPFCKSCGEDTPWRAYFLWPRRCPTCGAARGMRPWVVDIAFTLIAIWLWASPAGRLSPLISLFLIGYFGLVIVIDLEYRLILHPISLFGSLLGLGVGVSLHGWGATALGAIAGFGVMALLYILGIMLVRGLNRWKKRQVDEEALGFGDVILGGVIGLMLGWPGIVAGLVLAILLGGAVSLLYLSWMLLKRQYDPGLAIPYGPFLVGSAFLLLFFKDFALSIL